MDKTKFKEIIAPISEELNSFEIKLKEIINAENNFLHEDLCNFIFSNPKRLRPIFVFLFSKILEIKDPLVEDIALISELIHNASLIHDDIIDEEKERRNHPTFYEKYGSKLAVLEGDLLLSIALEKLSDTTKEISKIFAKKIKETINGEIIQNGNLNKITDIETYYKKTKEKTGNLFFCGLESLFSLKNIDLKTKEMLNNYLENYVLAFQIKNDIDNLKTDLTDIKNGNYTLPVIYFFMENHKLELFKDKNISNKFIDKSTKKVEELKSEAILSLNDLDSSIFKTTLINIANYSLRS